MAMTHLGTFIHAQDKKESDSLITTIPQLQAAIEKVLERTKTPAVGIAMVDANGPVWIAGLGKADREKNIDADTATMFRIGSTSKMFVSLSILKLVEEGKVSLDDKVRDLVPEVVFENKWEDTNPILVANLLEHTTGWDDLHFCEYAHSDSTPIRLKEGLAYHPHSRISRWVPGTRMSYCNSGPPVAALIVEKISGKDFETYVKDNFFTPMGMRTSTYLLSDEYRKRGATLYDNNKPQKYWHVIMRPSGSINASPADMARMVQFFVNEASVDSMQLVSKASLHRMETPGTTTAAKAGMQTGYGLNNYTSFHKGFVYHSHNGGVNGGLTDLSYLPGYKVGYAVMINAGNGNALDQITKLIRDYQTRDFTSPVVSGEPLTDAQKEIEGYYVSINPRNQKFYFLDRVLNIDKIWIRQDTVMKRRLLGGETNKSLSAGGTMFKSQKNGMNSMMMTTDPLDGDVVHSGTSVLKKRSSVAVFGPMVIGCLWILFMLSAVIFGIVWSLRMVMGQIPRGVKLQVRLWPMLATICAIVTFILFIVGLGDVFNLMGSPNAVSIGIMLLTIAFALTSVWGLATVVRYRKENIDGFVWWHSAIGAGLHVLVAIFLLYYGVIGLQIWA
jgi:CubicO group peptidase (beta-lactamase class C family)